MDTDEDNKPSGMQYKLTVVRIGLQFPRWPQVERKYSVHPCIIPLDPSVGRRKGTVVGHQRRRTLILLNNNRFIPSLTD
jgi:hypothetical protein